MSAAANDHGVNPDLEALTESPTDAHETRMTYDPKGGLPFYVIGVWMVAMVGLTIYFFTYWVGDLRAW